MFGTSVKVAFSQLDEDAMRQVYNTHAVVHGAPYAPADFGRFDLGKGIALFLSTAKPAPKKALTWKQSNANHARISRARKKASRGMSPAQIRKEAIAEELRHVECYKRNDVTINPAAYEAMNVKTREGFKAMGRSYASIANRLAVNDVLVSELQLRKIQFNLNQESAMPSRPMIRKRKDG